MYISPKFWCYDPSWLGKKCDQVNWAAPQVKWATYS